MPGEAPVLVDSAGCGAALKDYGRLLGTHDAEVFSARVFDVHEWLADHMDHVARSLQVTPMGRAALPEDIADAVCFLALGSSLMTGQVIVVDGGRTM